MLDEIKHANSIQKQVIIEVREEGVDYLRQRKGYDCLYRIRQQGKVIYHSVSSVEIVREGQEHFIYTDELPANLFHLTDVYLEVEVNIGPTQWSASGIRFNNPLEVPLETIDSVPKRYV